jgi:hypothetical protein
MTGNALTLLAISLNIEVPTTLTKSGLYKKPDRQELEHMVIESLKALTTGGRFPTC